MEQTIRILVVDDEPDIRQVLHSLLEAQGYSVQEAANGRLAVEFIRENPDLDLILMDIMMPELGGVEASREIRAISSAPILFLTAKSQERDMLQAYQSGGDDYLVKPFDGEELLMRLEALQRRSQRAKAQAAPAPSETLKVGEFEFDSVRQTLALNGTSVQLTPKEYQILYTLALKPETVMSKEELIEAVWGKEYLDDAISIAVYVRKIREKIEQNPAKPRYLKTAWGMGYSFSIK